MIFVYFTLIGQKNHVLFAELIQSEFKKINQYALIASFQNKVSLYIKYYIILSMAELQKLPCVECGKPTVNRVMVGYRYEKPLCFTCERGIPPEMLQ